MSVELQLNAVNLALVAFGRMHSSLDGQVLAFFSMVVAAAEVVVGLAIIVSVYRRRHSVNVDDARLLQVVAARRSQRRARALDGHAACCGSCPRCRSPAPP